MVLLDDAGFVDIVDTMGGVTVDLAQEADDPDTCSIYIPAGVQHLDGQSGHISFRDSSGFLVVAGF